jgi:hypothetical protein
VNPILLGEIFPSLLKFMMRSRPPSHQSYIWRCNLGVAMSKPSSCPLASRAYMLASFISLIPSLVLPKIFDASEQQPFGAQRIQYQTRDSRARNYQGPSKVFQLCSIICRRTCCALSRYIARITSTLETVVFVQTGRSFATNSQLCSAFGQYSILISAPARIGWRA